MFDHNLFGNPVSVILIGDSASAEDDDILAYLIGLDNPQIQEEVNIKLTSTTDCFGHSHEVKMDLQMLSTPFGEEITLVHSDLVRYDNGLVRSKALEAELDETTGAPIKYRFSVVTEYPTLYLIEHDSEAASRKAEYLPTEFERLQDLTYDILDEYDRLGRPYEKNNDPQVVAKASPKGVWLRSRGNMLTLVS